MPPPITATEYFDFAAACRAASLISMLLVLCCYFLASLWILHAPFLHLSCGKDLAS